MTELEARGTTDSEARGTTDSEARGTTDLPALRAQIEALYAAGPDVDADAARTAVALLLGALEIGEVRAARHTATGWEAVPWVKSGILLAFRVGQTRRLAGLGPDFFDRDTLPLRETDGVGQNIRIVPGGTSVRAGAHLAPNVVIMPPAYVNTGAWVGEGSMIDSHALVGSCAQVGERVHLSAGAQLGGVLEPVGLRPVIVEDDVLIGANTGVFEGTLVGERAVIATGVNLTRSTPLYDLVRGQVYRATADEPLTVPAGAVVVPGSRPARGAFAEEVGTHLYVPVIVKYRDERTDAASALEDALR